MTGESSWQHHTCVQPDLGVLVVLRGEIDINGANQLLGLLKAAIDSAHRVHVDLQAVEFIDSTVISALINARHTATDAGKEFAVINASHNVARTLNITGVLEALSPAKS
ncbi:STAS domain-containing protein [Micromonospora sp. DPT]|uniref:STAS domain-containing protein n=1 Tax=Micromonospora sp. DPT TaxID=3142975 RepID=UPI003207DA8B